MPRPDAPGPPSPPANGLLAALSPPERDALLPYLVPVALPARTALHEPGQDIAHVYFPTAGVVSLLAGGVEAAVVGREGMVGVPVFLGTDRSTGRCIVQLHLEALRMEAGEFRARVGRDGGLHGLLLLYTNYLLCQVSQSLACRDAHEVKQRLCRRLLLMHDRAGTDEFPLTHEFMALMLGVRRASVSEVASDLQNRGLIRTGRGRVSVLDRAALEGAACGCFGVLRDEWGRLFG